MYSIALAIIVLVVLAGATLRGMLASRRDRCRQAWGELRARLDRRAQLTDMVADLVAATVGERDELPARLRTARDAAGAAGRVAERIEAERAFVAALDAAFALARTYPALQANQEFARLRDERTSHDNRIAAAAEEYNEAVAAYNKAIAAFPARLVAELFGFEPEARFELHAEGAAS